MTRRKLIIALSILYVLDGLWDLGIFLYQSSSPSRPVYLDVTPLISGILALYVGFQLSQLHEIGRIVAIGLLYIRVAINLCFMVWFLIHREGVVSTGLYFLKRELYRINNPYVSEVYLLAGVLVALLLIAFLSQRETKRLFLPEISDDSGKLVESR